MKIREAYVIMSNQQKKMEYDSGLGKKMQSNFMGFDSSTSRRHNKGRRVDPKSANWSKDYSKSRFESDQANNNEHFPYEPTFQDNRDAYREKLKVALKEYEQLYKEYANKEKFYLERSGQRIFKPEPNENQYQRPDFVNVNLDVPDYEGWHKWSEQHSGSGSGPTKGQVSGSKIYQNQKSSKFDPKSSDPMYKFRPKPRPEPIYYSPGVPPEHDPKNRQKMSSRDRYYQDHMKNFKARRDPNFREFHQKMSGNVPGLTLGEEVQGADRGSGSNEKAEEYDPGHRPFNKSKEGFKTFLQDRPWLFETNNFITPDREAILEEGFDRIEMVNRKK